MPNAYKDRAVVPYQIQRKIPISSILPVASKLLPSRIVASLSFPKLGFFNPVVVDPEA